MIILTNNNDELVFELTLFSKYLCKELKCFDKCHIDDIVDAYMNGKELRDIR